MLPPKIATSHCIFCPWKSCIFRSVFNFFFVLLTKKKLRRFARSALEKKMRFFNVIFKHCDMEGFYSTIPNAICDPYLQLASFLHKDNYLHVQ